MKHLAWVLIGMVCLLTVSPRTAMATDLLAVQRQLNNIGFDVGVPDGKLGARTRYAIKAFQSSHGRPSTGQLSASDTDLLFNDQAAVVPSAPAVTGSDFEILRDTDIPFGDYRSGKEDLGLKGISLEQCRAACEGEGQCQAFTYNQKYKFCFLKDKVSGTAAFKGAISGRRLASDTLVAGETSSPAGLVGAPPGCPAQVAVIDRLRHDTTVSIDATSATVGDGKGVTLRWARGDFPERLPVFLMVSTPATVRFAGKNFYALTPAGKAAFDLKQFDGTTRAVVPLFGTGVPFGGTIRVDPLTEGSLDLKWDVVGMTDCGERAVAAPPELKVAVTAGAPEIIFQNPFTNQLPKERIASPAGDRMVDAFPGYYRLYDKGGHLIAERPGEQPRFSPTGRFVSAWTGDYQLQIIDGFDGAVLNDQSSVYVLGWDNADSFFVASAVRWAISRVGSPLAGESSVFEIGYGCHACTSARESMRFDLANNLVLMKDAVSSLTTSFAKAIDRTSNTQSADLRTLLASVRNQQTAGLVLPPDSNNEFDWQFGSERPLTSIVSDITMFGDQHIDAVPELEAHAAPVDRLSVTTPIAFVADVDGAATQVAMRGPSRVFPATHKTGLQHVTSQLRSLVFATETPVSRFKEPLETVKSDGSSRLVRLVDYPHFRLTGPESYSNCSEGAWPADGTIFAGSDTSVPMQRTSRFAILTTPCVEGSGAFMSSSTLLIDHKQPSKLADLSDLFVHEDKTNDVCPSLLGNCGFDLRVFDDRFVIFSSPLSNALAVYDGDQHKLIASYAAVPRSRMITDIAIDKTGRWLLLYFPGDLFSLLDLSIDQHPNAQQIIDLAHAADPIVLEGMVADNELIVWTNNLGFDATAEGAEFVSVRFAGRSDVYALTQFEAALRQKDLVNAVTSGTVLSDPVRQLAPPPAISTAEVNLAADGTSLDIALNWGSAPLSKLTVLQDGLITDTLNLSGKLGATSFATRRVRGAKWVTLLAQDAAGVASRPYSTPLPTDPRGNRTLRLVAVGVDKYDDTRLPSLPLARPDASNIGKAFSNLASVTLASAETLVDDATRSSSIRTAIASAVSASAADETLVLSFSGHGIGDDAGNLYLATRDTKLDDIANTALPWSDVAGMIAKAKGRVVVFLDTCHSGIAGTAYAAPSEGAVADFLTAIPSNLLIFSASKGREFSQEQTALGGGVFTNALVKALGSDYVAADSNGDGVLEISELYGYLRLAVARNTQGEQTPWFARNKMVGDFAVF